MLKDQIPKDANKFASFYINEIMPREKKTGERVPPEIVSSLYILMTEHGLPRLYVRKILDIGLGPVEERTDEELIDVISVLASYLYGELNETP